MDARRHTEVWLTAGVIALFATFLAVNLIAHPVFVHQQVTHIQRWWDGEAKQTRTWWSANRGKLHQALNTLAGAAVVLVLMLLVVRHGNRRRRPTH